MYFQKAQWALKKVWNCFIFFFTFKNMIWRSEHIYISQLDVLVNIQKEDIHKFDITMHAKLIPVSTIFEKWFCAMLKVLQFPEKINQCNILFMFQDTFDVYDGNKKVLHCSSRFIVLTGLKAQMSLYNNYFCYLKVIRHFRCLVKIKMSTRFTSTNFNIQWIF